MSRGRRRVVRGLIALGSVLAFLSVFAVWTERQALNTDDWVDTSGRLLQDSTIRTAIGNYLVDQLYANVDVERQVKGLLPGDAKQLAAPISGGLRQVGGQGADELLKTSTAQDLWQDANRAAHIQLLDVLENRKEAVSTSGGEVTLNLGSLVTNLADQIGIGSNLAEKLPPDAGQIHILRSDQLETAQNIARGVKGLALLFSVLTLIVFALAIYLSRDQRWVTILFCGVGLIAAGFAVIVARHIAGGIVVGQLVTDNSVKPAATDAWTIATSLMISIATTVIVVGVLFTAAGWLGSPTGTARTCRRWMAPVLRDHVPYVYTALAIVVGIYFLSAATQGLRPFLTTIIVAAMAAFGIHALRRQCEAEFPEASFEESFGRAKSRMVGAVRGANIGERASRLRIPEGLRSDRSRGGGEASGTAPGGGGLATPAGTPPQPAAPGADPEDARLARLERLAALHERGVLSDEELAAEKARILGADS